MLSLKIAFRNVLRNKRRTFFTAITIIIGCGLSVFSIGWADGTYNYIIKKFTSFFTGELQIHRGDYLDMPSIYKYMDYQVIEEKLKTVKNIKSFSKRIYSGGLISSGNKSFGVTIIGVDPEEEKKTVEFPKSIIKGKWLNDVVENEIILGDTLSKKLNVKLNDEVVLVSQAFDGSIANDLFKVVGIFKTDNDKIDRNLAITSHKTAEDFFLLYGKTHEFIITLKNPKKIDTTKNDIRDLFARENYTVSDWKEFSKEFYRAMKADKGGMWISLFVILLIVAVGVLNTILMSVLERMREFGVLKAIGTKPSFILKMIVEEALIISIAGIAVGSLLGFSINLYFSTHGYTLSHPFTYGGMKFSKMLSELNLRSFLIPAFSIILVAIVASLFPAVKASKTEPSKTLRFH